MARRASVPSPEARDRLLRAAEQLFAEKGYAATAVHEITDAAGVNRALLYYYFEDKHSLYAEVIGQGNAQFEAMLEQALSSPGSYADRLAAFVRGHLELIWTRSEMARIVHRCLLDGYHEEFGLPARFERGIGRLEAFFRDGMAAGEFRPLDPAITARSFIGPMYVFSFWRLYEGERFSREAIAEAITAQLLDGLRA
jgi:AcrR family transcriptional regulator